MPAFADGRTTTGALAAAAAAIIGVAVLRAGGTVVRRLGAGIMQYRLQASYRRRVTRQYLRLPMAWHQRHPHRTAALQRRRRRRGGLVSIAPFPLMSRSWSCSALPPWRCCSTTSCWRWWHSSSFRSCSSSISRTAPALAAGDAGAAARAGQRGRARVLGALVVKTLGAEGRDSAVRGAGRELRDALIKVGRSGMFDPAFEALPNSASSSSFSSEQRGCRQAASIRATWWRRPTCSPCSRSIRAIGFVLGELRAASSAGIG